MKTQVFKTSKVLTLLTGINLVEDEPINDLVGFLLKTPMGTKTTIGVLNWCKAELLRQFPTFGGVATTEMLAEFKARLELFDHDDDRMSYCRVWRSEQEEFFPVGMTISEPSNTYFGRRRPSIGGSFIMEKGGIGYIG